MSKTVIRLAVALSAILAFFPTSNSRGEVVFTSGRHTPVFTADDAFKGILSVSGRKSVLVAETHHSLEKDDPTAFGSVIDLNFRPTGLVTLTPTATGFVEHPITVAHLANYLGFDHFNFINRVTLPDTWFAYTLNMGKPDPLPRPHIDPNVATVYINSPGSIAAGVTAFVAPVGDGSGFYWNEDPPQWKNYFKVPKDGTKLIDNPNNPFAFTFEDRPGYDSVLYGASDSVKFDTTLVGVNADGTINTKYNWFDMATKYGSGTEWKTNSATGVVVSYEQTPDTGSLPDIISGGVFDVTPMNLASVPEPSTLALACSAGAVCLCYRWLRRRE